MRTKWKLQWPPFFVINACDGVIINLCHTFHDQDLVLDHPTFGFQSPLKYNIYHQTNPNYKSLLLNLFYYCITASTRITTSALQKLPSVEGAKNSWAPPWGNLGCDWPTQIESQDVSQSEASVKQNSYRSGPVTEPPRWERSECKGLEAVKDRIWNFKH